MKFYLMPGANTLLPANGVWSEVASNLASSGSFMKAGWADQWSFNETMF